MDTLGKKREESAKLNEEELEIGLRWALTKQGAAVERKRAKRNAKPRRYDYRPNAMLSRAIMKLKKHSGPNLMPWTNSRSVKPRNNPLADYKTAQSAL